MPQNQLLDALFGLFRETEFWSVKDLRLKTEQPEAYLKETLAQIAILHRSGPVRVSCLVLCDAILLSLSVRSTTASGS
jgi:TFIIF, beta subunit HTH domain